MAGNKIIEKIEEEARQGAAAIEAEAKQKAEAEKRLYPLRTAQSMKMVFFPRSTRPLWTRERKVK